ncbi:MAG: leucine-rich repeat domain-containing protein [Clostridia bacterium]
MSGCALAQEAPPPSIVTLYGVDFPADAVTIDFGDVLIKDIGQLKAGLPLFTQLEQADMYQSTLSREQMAELSQAFPSLHFGWTLLLGSHQVRTDTTAFSSLHSPENTHYSSDYYSILKYCYQLQALDLGHNKLTTLSFLSGMTDLRLLILADNQIRDISPIANLKKLEYVELFMNQISDISPLEGMENLLDLNLAHNRLKDLSATLTCPKLQRLWVSHNKLSKAYQQQLQTELPNVDICFSSWGSTSAGWREHERYFVIKDVFDHWVYRPFAKEESH